MSEAVTTGSPKGPILGGLFSDRRSGAMLGLGFSSGIPYLLIHVTQPAWLSEAKMPRGHPMVRSQRMMVMRL